MIYFTSDTHYHHKNIVKGTTAWEGNVGNRTRNFETLEQHNAALVSNINACVGEDDILYHLGDWSFGGIDQIWNFRKQLKCKTIHLIYGNHDEKIEEKKEFIIPEEETKIYEELFKERMGSAPSQRTITVDRLFSSVNHYLEISVNRQKMVLCHYAMRVWNKSHRGNWMLYGHSHGTLDDLKPQFAEPTWIGDDYYIKNAKTMDVGVDTHKEFRPYSITELQEIMAKKEILLNIDHHGKHTN